MDVQALLKECESNAESRQVLADFITDNPALVADALAGVVRRLPEIIAPIIREKLALYVSTEKEYVPARGSQMSGTQLRYVHLALSFDGVEIARHIIDLWG
jgi:hypothetical protein